MPPRTVAESFDPGGTPAAAPRAARSEIGALSSVDAHAVAAARAIEASTTKPSR
jgi:hypothetical protein